MKFRITKIVFSFILIIGISFSSQSQEKLSKITKSGVIRIGTTGSQPPFSMESRDGTLMGFEIDLAEILAQSMNVKLELVRMSFKELIPALEEGKVDAVLSGMTITMDRNMKVPFVGPYTLSGKSILTKMESLAKIDEAADLNQSDLKISYLAGSTSEKFAKLYISEAKALPSKDYKEAVDKLLSDEANVLLADYPICVMTILRNPVYNLVTLEEPLTVEPIGMAIAPGDPLMINFFENYLTALAMSGILIELEQYWFESDAWVKDVKW